VACHASTVVVERASARNSAYVRIDVKRRDAFTAPVTSPLVDLVDPHTPSGDRHLAPVPTALDLPDVAITPTPVKVPAPRSESNGHKPTTPQPVPAGAGGEDLSDWIA
jgi:hypothetical protein